ncbi:DUF2750 domain-containing protein [Flavobacterium sp. CBA20B-1]|uniref:DUF2750 domain-containing protein n=1 Tax=unclassified Flavobacterium TaxID=196869 RepID=UPI0022242C09|nr:MULTISPECIES: DUF2750 domain-containing protein [unclassified Flavobacterium]WCM42206.1 DUF2750 domain-containing protein [Flavobacterium sp. CBA20B-1]
MEVKMIEDFLNHIVQNNKVFIIEHKNEIAISQSLLFTNNANEPVNVVCFWDNEDLAKACCVDIWRDYTPQEICLTTFIEDYLVNIYNESFIVGINFNDQMEGIEADPLDIISNIIQLLKKQKMELDFEYFKNLADLERQLQKLL